MSMTRAIRASGEAKPKAMRVMSLILVFIHRKSGPFNVVPPGWRVDEWVLYAQEAVSQQHSRGLAHGKFFSRDGALPASVAQGGEIRVAASR